MTPEEEGGAEGGGSLTESQAKRFQAARSQQGLFPLMQKLKISRRSCSNRLKMTQLGASASQGGRCLYSVLPPPPALFQT